MLMCVFLFKGWQLAAQRSLVRAGRLCLLLRYTQFASRCVCQGLPANEMTGNVTEPSSAASFNGTRFAINVEVSNKVRSEVPSTV